MKKMAFLLVFAVIVTAITTLVAPEVKAQKEIRFFDGSVDDEKVPVTIRGVYSLKEGWGFSLTENFFQVEKPYGLFLTEEFTQKSQLGLVFGCKPYVIFSYVYIVGAIEWQYRLKIITTHGQPTKETFKDEDKMILSFRVGPSFEIGRFELAIFWNPGQWWVPSNNETIQDWQWYQSFAITTGLKF